MRPTKSTATWSVSFASRSTAVNTGRCLRIVSSIASTSASVTVASGRSSAIVSTDFTLKSGSTSNSATYLRSLPGVGRDRLDARIGGRAHLFLVDRRGERLAQQVGDDLGLHLRAELLAHHGKRRLARAEALQARRAGDVLEALVDFARDALGRDGHFETTLERTDGGQRYLHDRSLMS